MNVSYDWLRAFVSFHQTPAQLRDLITARVAIVDELVPLRADLEPIVVARVVEAAPLADSDHLSITKVDAGTGELLDVVCGAPNVQAGKLYPFAPTGTVMPNGLKIQRRKIMGAVSNGMLCSPRELGLGDDHQGIMELDVNAAPGTPFLRAMPIGDARLVIDVMPNRPDLLSHLGVAREIAAAVDSPLALPALPEAVISVPSAARVRTAGSTAGVEVRVDEEGLARRYMGVVVRGVRVGPSPDWLVRRLEAVGSRSINNVVDATNYVLHELGQPTHAFDLAKLARPAVVVRRAAKGETIVTLDGVQRTLDDTMTVIADAARPQAIAGVIGGHDSEVTSATTDVFLEVASFDPARTRAARRALGFSTDASYRFERGVDPMLAPFALERVTQVVIAVAGGRVDGAPLDVYAGDPIPNPLTLRPARIAAVLGEPLRADHAASLLRSVGFDATVEPDDVVRVLTPTWRGDIAREIDLIEEVARLHGYDAFPDDIRPFRASNVPDDPLWLAARRVRDALVGAGLLEARPMPFVRGAEEGFVRVANPLAENEAFLRREIVDTLARRAEYNLARKQSDLRLFEIGSVFFPTGGAMPKEELHVGAVIMGRRYPRHFTDPKAPELEAQTTFDAWDAKALGELIARQSFPDALVELRAGEREELWQITLAGGRVGTVRQLALDAREGAPPAFGVELSLARYDATYVAPPGRSAHRAATYPTPTAKPYQPLPSTPAADFDLSLLVPPGVLAADIERVIRRTSGELLESVELVDEYLDDSLGPGNRSLAWHLTFRHPERTLRDKEIEGRRSNVIRQLESTLNVKQRTS
jgi:phenylalanyl-tRNA synthetase beta chain